MCVGCVCVCRCTRVLVYLERLKGDFLPINLKKKKESNLQTYFARKPLSAYKCPAYKFNLCRAVDLVSRGSGTHSFEIPTNRGKRPKCSLASKC